MCWPAGPPVLHVSCRDTFVVTNLLQHPVLLQMIASSDGKASQTLVIDPDSSQPIGTIWSAAHNSRTAATDAAVAAAAAASANDTIPPASASKDEDVAQTPQPATWPCNVGFSVPAEPCNGGLQHSDTGQVHRAADVPDRSQKQAAVVSLAQPCRRRWLSVPRDGHLMAQQITYRLRRMDGIHHLVLYEDLQPPLHVINSAGDDCEAHSLTSCCRGVFSKAAGNTVTKKQEPRLALKT